MQQSNQLQRRNAAFALISTLAVLLGLTPACSREPAPTLQAPPAAAPAPTNRIAAPLAVRRNLGISFAKVERRPLGRTLRYPGHFELTPAATTEYRCPLVGRIEILVDEFERVAAGASLYRIDSPEWHELRRELETARAESELARVTEASIAPLLAAHEAHHRELERKAQIWDERVVRLETLKQAGNVGAEVLVAAQSAAATAHADLAETLEKEAEIEARANEARTRRESADARFELLLSRTASLAGLSRAELLEVRDGALGWRSLATVEVRATRPGVVVKRHAHSGSWLDRAAPVLTVVDPMQLRFRARALQGDLHAVRTATVATILSPDASAIANDRPIPGTVTLASIADLEQRSLDIIVAFGPVEDWPRAGLAGYAQIELPGNSPEALSIPLGCVVADGVDRILFRRDPADPDQLIRLEADLGIDDGRFVELRSGVKEGDEIVLDGVYPLLIATSGSIKKGGHFHPDGSYHEGDG